MSVDAMGAPRRGTSDLTFVLMAAFGLILILYGLSSVIGPRAHFKGSNPSPGARLPNAPESVTVWFTDSIDPGSQLRVEFIRAADARVGRPRRLLATALGPDPMNPLSTSLRVVIPESREPGAYPVRWETRSHRGPRMIGAFVFGVTADTLQRVEADVVERGITPRRGGWSAVVGGVACMLIALGGWWLRHRYPDESNTEGRDPNPPGTWGEAPPT